MRVLHLSTPASWRGGEQQLAYLLGELRELGVQQQLICAAGGELASWATSQDFAVHPVSRQPIAYALAVRRRLRQGDIDIVHAHDARAHSLALLALLTMPKPAKFVVSRRVDFPVKPGWLSQFKYSSAELDLSLCVSECVAAVLQRSVANIGGVAVVHSGIDPKRFTQSSARSSLREQLQLAESAKLVGQIAALAPQKDYPTFIKCAELMAAERDDVFFVIVGSGSLEAQIRAQVARSAAASRIFMLGFRRDVAELLPQLDLLLLSSKTEGLGTTVLDAFAAGVPVVATRAGGIVEMVQHQQTGLLADVGDFRQLASSGLQLLADATLAQKLSAAATVLLQSNFTKQATARKTHQHYLNLLSESA